MHAYIHLQKTNRLEQAVVLVMRHLLVGNVVAAGSVSDGIGLGLDELRAVGQHDLLVHTHTGIDAVQGLGHAGGQVHTAQCGQEQARGRGGSRRVARIGAEL